MNRLIAFLRLENNLTVERLREIYRALCMEAHPDRGRGSEEGFKLLQKEYEAALSELSRRGPGGRAVKPHHAGSPPGRDPRRTVLELLYMYTVRFYGSESERQMAALTDAARAYSPHLAALLDSYNEVFLSCFHSWESSGSVYYTHCLLLSAIKQLFYHFAVGLPHQERLFHNLLGELERKAGALQKRQREVLLGLARWLREEGEKERIPFSFV